MRVCARRQRRSDTSLLSPVVDVVCGCRRIEMVAVCERASEPLSFQSPRALRITFGPTHIHTHTHKNHTHTHTSTPTITNPTRTREGVREFVGDGRVHLGGRLHRDAVEPERPRLLLACV